MLHPSTKRLIDKLSEMTRRQKVAWQEAEGGEVTHDTEGYRVTLTPDPCHVILTDALGREIEHCGPDEFANAVDADGRPYAQFVSELYREARRHARGAEKAINALLAGLDEADAPPPPAADETEVTGAAEEEADAGDQDLDVIIEDPGDDSDPLGPDMYPEFEGQSDMTHAVRTLADQVNGEPKVDFVEEDAETPAGDEDEMDEAPEPELQAMPASDEPAEEAEAEAPVPRSEPFPAADSPEEDTVSEGDDAPEEILAGAGEPEGDDRPDMDDLPDATEETDIQGYSIPAGETGEPPEDEDSVPPLDDPAGGYTPTHMDPDADEPETPDEAAAGEAEDSAAPMAFTMEAGGEEDAPAPAAEPGPDLPYAPAFASEAPDAPAYVQAEPVGSFLAATAAEPASEPEDLPEAGADSFEPAGDDLAVADRFETPAETVTAEEPAPGPATFGEAVAPEDTVDVPEESVAESQPEDAPAGETRPAAPQSATFMNSGYFGGGFSGGAFNPYRKPGDPSPEEPESAAPETESSAAPDSYLDQPAFTVGEPQGESPEPHPEAEFVAEAVLEPESEDETHADSETAPEPDPDPEPTLAAEPPRAFSLSGISSGHGPGAEAPAPEPEPEEAAKDTHTYEADHFPRPVIDDTDDATGWETPSASEESGYSEPSGAPAGAEESSVTPEPAPEMAADPVPEDEFEPEPVTAGAEAREEEAEAEQAPPRPAKRFNPWN